MCVAVPGIFLIILPETKKPPDLFSGGFFVDLNIKITADITGADNEQPHHPH